jgi:Fur family transcriptional regulator, ferric uptake regulator
VWLVCRSYDSGRAAGRCVAAARALDFYPKLAKIPVANSCKKGSVNELQWLIDQVRQNGLRVTRQRVLILQALCELDGHASAERIFERVSMHRRDVDLSTVYRTLERLRDLRILSQTDLGRGCVEFEVIAGQPHHHLVCHLCGQVQDLPHGYLASLAKAIRRDLDFEPALDHLAVFGLCFKCCAGDYSTRKGKE